MKGLFREHTNSISQRYYLLGKAYNGFLKDGKLVWEEVKEGVVNLTELNQEVYI